MFAELRQGVYREVGRVHFRSTIVVANKTTIIGEKFRSAAEAALAYARHLGSAHFAAEDEAASRRAADPAMSKAEAQRLAHAEGLELVLSEVSPTGFKWVRVRPGCAGAPKPFEAHLTIANEEVAHFAKGRRGRLPGCRGESHELGHFRSAPEAALACARVLGPEHFARIAAAELAANAIASGLAAHAIACTDASVESNGNAAVEPGGRTRRSHHKATVMAAYWARRRALEEESSMKVSGQLTGAKRPAAVSPESESPQKRPAAASDPCARKTGDPIKKPGASTQQSGRWLSHAGTPDRPAHVRIGPGFQVDALPEPASSSMAASLNTPSADPVAQQAPVLVRRVEVESDVARGTAAAMTAAAYGPIGPFCFVAPSDCGLGLFARVPLRPGQYIVEYSGPRLPLRLQVRGRYVLQVPGTSTVIDGACENSPFELPPSPAIFANHASIPNARVETWPVERPGPWEVRQRVMLVASEPIAAGREVRINYEGGGESLYWDGQPPPESSHWRMTVVPTPPPSVDIVGPMGPHVGPPSGEPSPQPLEAPLAWEGVRGGDARLHALVPWFSADGRRVNKSAWPLVSTHMPGRSGHECRERWLLIGQGSELARWLQSTATAPVTHVDAAAAMRAANAAAAAAALAAAGNSSDEEGATGRDRCCLRGCRSQLLRCHGKKLAGAAHGAAESSHVVCSPCLQQWFVAQASLREEAGLLPLSRKTCPVCQSELRAAAGEIRADTSQYVLGLRKVEGSWLNQGSCV